MNQFFAYRQNQLYISSVSVQIIALPVGKLMAAYLPSKPIRIPFTKWSFSLNPGPFSLKEHVLITIFASAGAGGVYAVHIFTSTNAFYKRKISPFAAFLLSQTTQVFFTSCFHFNVIIVIGNWCLILPFTLKKKMYETRTPYSHWEYQPLKCVF